MAGNFSSSVSLTAPTDYTAEGLSIERRRQLAQALYQQGQEPLQTNQTAGGYVIPVSPLQGLAKALQAGLGAYSMNRQDQAEKDLAKKYQTDLADTLTKSQAAMAGSAAIPGQPPMTPNDDNGNPNPPVSATPGQAPNPQLAASLLMQHPATQALGMSQIQSDMTRQQTMQRLKDILKVTGGDSSGGVPGATGAPGQAGLGSLPPQVTALMASGDPTLAKLGEALLGANKGIAQRPGAPIVNPITGAVIAQPTPAVPPGVQLNVGPNGPSASPLPGYAGAREGLNSIPDPGAAPVKIPLSGGQTAEVTQPEWLEYQRTHQLPARYGAPASPAPTAPAAAPGVDPNARIPRDIQARRDTDALRAVQEELDNARNVNPTQVPALEREVARLRQKTGGLGVPGLTQSQPDLIEQERQRAGGKATDEAFAKDYVSFTQGGAQDAAKQLSQLQEVSAALKQPGADLTGPIRGSAPDFVQKFTSAGQKAIAMRERVEEVVQRSLRAVLGAQFTENEGARLIARAYNPSLSESENAVRVDRLLTQLQQAYATKQDAARYFEKNGTLQGWQGKLPSAADFDPTPSRESSGTVPQGIDAKVWAHMTPQERALWQK